MKICITLKTDIQKTDMCIEEKEMENSDGENLNLLVKKISKFLKYKNKSKNKFVMLRKKFREHQ